MLEMIQASRRPGEACVHSVVAKGLKKEGLKLDEVAVLINTSDPAPLQKIFAAAAQIKDDIYGERLVLFAPLYVSDHCVNDCEYCNFHIRNTALDRRMLTMEEIASETKCLIDMGHKRLLIEFGEDPHRNGIDSVCQAIETVYSVRSGRGDIRRVNVNIAATTTENYRRLKEAGIGTYQLFQETYHRPTYETLHKGPKADYDRQLAAHEQAFAAGLDDLGIGVLFGLYDWRFEVLALVAHAQYMERTFGVGPHTISVPRFQPGPTVTYEPGHPVHDDDFLKIIAILRIAVPYAGMILTTREMPDLRRRAFRLGISQASAASVCSPGGYQKREGVQKGQFINRDHRSVGDFVKSVVADGLLPSFCTACYRSGRTGDRFMGLAKPGDIHNFCRPNAILTFAEYLEDYGDEEAKQQGNDLIGKCLGKIEDIAIRELTRKRIEQIKRDKRDLYF